MIENEEPHLQCRVVLQLLGLLLGTFLEGWAGGQGQHQWSRMFGMADCSRLFDHRLGALPHQWYSRHICLYRIHPLQRDSKLGQAADEKIVAQQLSCQWPE
ncbi:hypothetical protein FOXG_19318 [Fusarium oxysporum f. sp. lycopersici 4287]|uniref:Uncharacterized protein n=1 Tax=Fusarium oxysporum f. sp. lycopersici (strain 4287 / CBS 123668 / FGSC 9935 / NRRL 34936) TaxID=426428 RepID=A0A0J9V025_FUSO4|nr:hypothetical protein FOXG_19318 [Fusarium oxysporum f. sp. lycopersici 4287]KNB04523.1 hypothetical protein FOXG_19318 [Fusarium oxysporum f. sp. lycopersici 4287]